MRVSDNQLPDRIRELNELIEAKIGDLTAYEAERRDLQRRLAIINGQQELGL